MRIKIKKSLLIITIAHYLFSVLLIMSLLYFGRLHFSSAIHPSKYAMKEKIITTISSIILQPLSILIKNNYWQYSTITKYILLFINSLIWGCVITFIYYKIRKKQREKESN